MKYNSRQAAVNCRSLQKHASELRTLRGPTIKTRNVPERHCIGKVDITRSTATAWDKRVLLCRNFLSREADIREKALIA